MTDTLHAGPMSISYFTHKITVYYHTCTIVSSSSFAFICLFVITFSVDSFSCFTLCSIRVSDCFFAFLNLFYNKHRVTQATHTTVITSNIIIMHKFSYIHYAQILHIKTHYKTSCAVSFMLE